MCLFQDKNPCHVENMVRDCIFQALFISFSSIVDYTLHFIWHFESFAATHSGQILDWDTFLRVKCETKTLFSPNNCSIYNWYIGIFTLFVDFFVFLIQNISCILVAVNATALYKRSYEHFWASL